jgi:hypothetical protein
MERRVGQSVDVFYLPIHQTKPFASFESLEDINSCLDAGSLASSCSGLDVVD